MQFFGIGPLEFLLIAVIAIIVLGPKGMVKAARETGKLIRKVIRSPLWREMMDTSREIRNLPNKIAREAGIEEDLEDLRRSARDSMAEIDRSVYPENQPGRESEMGGKPREINPPEDGGAGK